jgi:peptidoglycan/xylan/chitin deacetylase (PgdA/CDA1 family)
VDGVLSIGPVRDFVGYGPEPPEVHWPDGALLAVNLVVNYEEGAEYSFPDDGVNDTWGEYSFQYGPQTRDFGTEMHMEYGSRVGVWRLCRLFDRYRVNVTFNACARALERNPRLSEWLRGHSHDVLGYGYRWYGADAPGAEAMTREAERTEIRTAIESVKRTTGQRVRGWMVRSFPTVHTRELLVEEGGFLYDSDSTNDETALLRDGHGDTTSRCALYQGLQRHSVSDSPHLRDAAALLRDAEKRLDYILDEARRARAGRMMSVGIHARWSGQAARASAVRDFIEYGLAQDGVRFMRRIDIAEHWVTSFAPG